ncbi:MAG: HIT family protein [Acidimicrobiia bacterium]|nr:HIT family protein [Acidimicrobiia bacterium]
MPTIFSRIIAGELPGHFVWRDRACVAFLSINPHRTGHTLVVPVVEVGHWIDLDRPTNEHLMGVSAVIGEAQMQVFSPPRIGLMIAGFEVPHVHLHVLPMFDIRDLDFANAATDVDHTALAAVAGELRASLAAAGHGQASDR